MTRGARGEMKVHLVKVPRLPGWPLSAVGLLVAGFALVGAGAWWAMRQRPRVELCLFKRLTGWPCPTCGAARGMFCVLRGEPLSAWKLNPLLFTVLAAAAALAALRLLLARAVRVEMARREKLLALVAAAALVLLNWAYVIVQVG